MSDDGSMLAVTRYADVAACLQHPALSSAVDLDAMPNRAVAAVLSRQMDLSDGARHAELRRALAGAFGRASLDRLRPFIAQWLAARVAQLPPSFDVIEAVARPLPRAVILQLLGMPAEADATVERCVDAFVSAVATPAQADPAAADALASLTSVVRAARGRHDLDAASVLGAAAATAALPIEDIVANVILIAAAGRETTTHLIGNGAWLLLSHAAARASLTADPGQWPPAIEEILRFESPIQSVRRVCTARVEIAGEMVPPGTPVMLKLGAANRDPEAFDAADRFDVTRTPNRHLAFGSGAHACLGAGLARMQGRLALEALLATPIRLIDPEPHWLPSPAYRGLARLRVSVG